MLNKIPFEISAHMLLSSYQIAIQVIVRSVPRYLTQTQTTDTDHLLKRKGKNWLKIMVAKNLDQQLCQPRSITSLPLQAIYSNEWYGAVAVARALSIQ